MQVKIEPVQSEEIGLLTTVSRTTFYDTFHTFNTQENMELFLSHNLQKNSLKLEMEQAHNHFFFAKVNGEIAGYLKLSTARMPELDEDEILEISRIYVVKEKLGAGIGKAQMEFAISFAKTMNKTTLCLGVWENNHRAIAFYKSFGFEKFGEHIFMLGTDAQTDFLMKRSLVA